MLYARYYDRPSARDGPTNRLFSAQTRDTNKYNRDKRTYHDQMVLRGSRGAV